MTCPRCQQLNPASAKFCNSCGAKLESACPACGHPNVPGSRFCNECGEPLRAAPEPPALAPASYTPPHLAARIMTSRAALEGERKLVTVLFADVKGSMELLADRDPEEARRLLDPVLERMMEAVHHYEGTVNQVMGDGIMALFGAPLAHEDHALRACFAALRMQGQVGRYGDDAQRTHGVPIQIRVGLNSGEVVVRSIGSDLHMDYTAVGQTTHLAARMEQIAKPGSTLLSAGTYRLVEGYARVRALGPVPIRGLAEPVDVFELLGAEGARTRLQVAAGRGFTRFIGREIELSQLRTALDRARAGHGQIVAVVGEPGVGKSRLIWELTHSHRTDGWLTLESSSVSYGSSTSWRPILDLLKAYLGIQDGDDARRVRERLIGKLLALDEGLRTALPALEALLDLSSDDPAWTSLGVDDRRARIVDAVKRLLLRESQAQPLLLILEDLHWIDADSQALLDGLIDSLASHRILLLVNYRPEYGHAWGSKTYYGQIRLDPLLAESAEALVDSLLGPATDQAALRSLLVQRADGNPFFLEESVQALADAGVLVGERGAYRLVQAPALLQVPATVQAILAARIDRLRPEDKAALQSASVVGKDVPLPLLEAIAGVPRQELEQRLGRLRAAEFLYETRLFPDVELTFKHALTHEVAYASLLAEQRRILHARVVDAIEHLYPEGLAEHRGRLVHHAFRGEVWSKALAYLRDTGTVASPSEIAEVMGQGPENPGRLWWAGEHEKAVKAAERDLAVAASFKIFPTRVVASCRLGQAHHALGRYDKAVELLQQTVALFHDDLVHEHFGMAAFPSVWARSWLALSLAERGEFDAGIAASEEGIRIAESGQHAYSRVQAAFGLGSLHVIQGRADCAIPVLEQGLVLARLENVPFLVQFLLGPLGAAYALGGQVDRALSLLEQAVEQATAIGLVAHQARRLTWLGRARLLAGRRDAAVDLARRALLLAEKHQESGEEVHALCLLADATAGSAGPDDPADAAYRRALGLAEGLGMRPMAARCQTGLARLSERSGHGDRARELERIATRMYREMGMGD
jgi:class 3 adenylate cyclase/tetratricopeptide (TPR) repeat protein